MSDVASQANVCYNSGRNIVVTQQVLTHLLSPFTIRRVGSYRMDILSSNSPDGNPEKRCTGPCGRVLPATPEYFCRNKQKKDGLLPQCKECKSKTDKEYRNRPEVKVHKYAVRSEYRSQPEIRAKERAYYQDYNKDYLTRPGIQERRSANGKEYCSRPDVKAHKRGVRALYRSKPVAREQERKYNSSRRARKQSVAGVYTPAQIQEQLERQRYRCYYAACGFSKFEKRNGRYIYHIDHTFPLSRVASSDVPANDISYLVLACPHCNTSKGDKYPWEWPEGGRLL